MRNLLLKKKLLAQKGFTLVELLIVVVILGLLATVVVRQFGTATGDAKLATLKANLASVRGAIELYKSEHEGVNPGKNPTTTGGADAESNDALLKQLTQYTDVDGVISGTKVGVYKYGPYLNKIPDNPYAVELELTAPDGVTVVAGAAADTFTTALSATGGTDNNGWKYGADTGRFIANDSADNEGY